jgi:hypothetical protein
MPYTPSPLEGKPPTGLGGVAVTKVERQLKAQAVMPSTDIMVDRTTSGTFLHLRQKGAAGGGLKLVEVTIKSTWADGEYFIGEVGGVEVTVLLPRELHYGYKDLSSTDAKIKPDYIPGEIIFCVKNPDTTFPDYDYLDLNLGARRWSVPVSFCQSGHTLNLWLAAVK